MAKQACREYVPLFLNKDNSFLTSNETKETVIRDVTSYTLLVINKKKKKRINKNSGLARNYGLDSP